MTSWLPDVNVWLALHFERHEHHPISLAWLDSLDEKQPLIFCRQTQLAFFRLLTTPSVMGAHTLIHRQCWAIYDEWLTSGRAIHRPEPSGIELAFRARTLSAEPAPKTWMDAYLAVFAEAGDLTLVTFDKALAARTRGALLLA